MVEAAKEFRGTERFSLRRKLGAGGMGVVHEAIYRLTNKPVALKTLNRAEPEHIYRLKREFRELADVSHPNLANRRELRRPHRARGHGVVESAGELHLRRAGKAERRHFTRRSADEAGGRRLCSGRHGFRSLTPCYYLQPLRGWHHKFITICHFIAD